METYKDKSLGVLNAGIAAGATSLVLQSGQGANFPAPATEGSFYVWIWRSDYATPALDPTAEKVLCSARTTDTLTIGATVNAHNTAGKTYYVMAALNPTTQTKLSALADIVEVSNSAAVLSKAIHAGGDNGGYLFDGVNDYLSIADNDNLDFGTNTFTIEFFGILNLVASYTQRLLIKTSSNINIEIQISAGTTALVFVLGDGTNIYYEIFNSLFTSGEKVHILWVVNRTGQFSVYKNGVLLSKTSAVGTLANVGSLSNAGNLIIGNSTTTHYLLAAIYKLAFYNRALTLAEAISYYNNGRPDLYVIPYADRGASQTDLVSGKGSFSTNVANATEFGTQYSPIIVNSPGLQTIVVNANVLTLTSIDEGSKGISIPNLIIGKKYILQINVASINNGMYVKDHPGWGSGNNYQYINAIGNYNIVFVASSTSLYFVQYLNGSYVSFNGLTVQFKLTQLGNVAEYLPQNTGNLGWIDSSGNQLSGATSGSPICLTTQSRPALHREIKKSIANTATTLTGIVPRGYRIAAVRLKASAAITAVKIGTSSGGEQIVASTSASATATLATLAATVNAGYSETADTTLYVEHATAGQTLDVIFELMKVGN